MLTEEELKAKGVEVVKQFEGMLFDGGDRYYSSIEEFFEDWWNFADKDEKAPEYYYLYLTTPVKLSRFDFDEWLTEYESDQGFDEETDIFSMLKGIEDVKVAIDRFHELNKDVILGYAPDMKRVIKFTKEDFDD